MPSICVLVGVDPLLSNFLEESSSEKRSCGSIFEEAVMQSLRSIEFSLRVFSKDFLNSSRKNRAGFLLLLCTLLLWCTCLMHAKGEAYGSGMSLLRITYRDSLLNRGLAVLWGDTSWLLFILFCRHSNVMYSLIVIRGLSKWGESNSSGSRLVDWL